MTSPALRPSNAPARPDLQAREDNMKTAAAHAATWYQRTVHGRPDQVARIRREIAAHLQDCPAADDAVLIVSELAANAVTHSASQGEFFTIRCQAYPDYVWIECEDLGGPWQCRPPDDRPHGLDIISALTGPDNWGTETTSDGDRIVWARLDLPRNGSGT
jgi:anti-sigma regulatory factor (Ser/Thr protein kinase)